MAAAIEACVHCGFCLPVCPTYRLLGEEMDSPRGRIFLMKDVLEGSLPLADALPFVDRCLGCVGCVPACPSGVPYGELLMTFRAHSETQRHRSLQDKATRALVRKTLPYADRFRTAAQAGRLVRRVKDSLPSQLGAMVALLPDKLPPAEPLPELVPAIGVRRARVALLAGCVQQVLSPEINWATARVLARNGVEVIIPKNQGCCGALSMHIGDFHEALDLARNSLDAFPADVDAIITNAAGCGSAMHEYPVLFKGHPAAAQAEAFAAKAMDISMFLDTLGWETPPPLKRELVVVYHDPCHLAHAQGVREAPRRLLASIPQLTLVEIAESDLCCGSAGTYNIDQPGLAYELGQRKARHILAANPHALVTGNVGCLTQIQAHLKALGKPLPLYHTIQLLDIAYAQGL
jgi:glycolate oxidase iron-sulfur subunit